MTPDEMQTELAKHGIETTLVTDEKNRTLAQNSSLHLWLERLATELNDSGQSMGDGLLIKIPIAYTKDNLKENVVKPLMNALWPDITSTTKLSTVQIQELYQRLDAIISERSGVHVEWPSEESLYYEATYGSKNKTG